MSTNGFDKRKYTAISSINDNASCEVFIISITLSIIVS